MILPQSLLYQQSTLIYRLNAIILVVAEDLPRPTHQVYKKKKTVGFEMNADAGKGPLSLSRFSSFFVESWSAFTRRR